MGLAPFGLAAAVTAAASFTVLQAVDGIALKRAVDAWVSAPADQESAAFAAAEAVRWIEMGMNSLSCFLAGVNLFLYGVAIVLGSVYPRWAGLIAVISGVALMYNGVVEVAYEDFVASTIRLVGLALWAFIMAVLMWRNGSRRHISRLASTPTDPAQRPASHTNGPNLTKLLEGGVCLWMPKMANSLIRQTCALAVPHAFSLPSVTSP